MTTHLTDEDLILHYYGETERGEAPRVESHLASCDECRLAKDKLARFMTLVDGASPVEAPVGFERTAWARLEPQLEGGRGGEQSAWRTFFWFPQWALAGGVAALVLAAFVAGRFTSNTTPVAAPVAAVATEVEPERVLRAAVGDHLDRTQMMLVELANADTDNIDVLAGEQGRAADLVAANRLMRQSAAQSGDAGIADVLEDLERVLLEIANAPADASSNELNDLQSRITKQDLLFRLRVIASEMRQRNKTDREAGDRLPQRMPTS
jgi:anti-sigma factor RsiW